ncbi:MAG: PilW family protein, partial [Gammaproteobacteria bacterium]
MLRPVRRRVSGFSLVELMVSIAVGLMVLAGITTMFAHNVKA